jgi:hypothetical protein
MLSTSTGATFWFKFMSNSDFTVLMSVYSGDDARLFSRALDSIYCNSRLPNAVVLVIDGPVPPSIQDVVDKFRDHEGMFILALPANLGLAGALNAGLVHVNTTWVVRADADDFNYASRFEVLCAAMSMDVDLLGSGIREVERDGQAICERRLPLNHAEIVKFMERRNPFNHMSVAFRTELARECGGYPRLHLREDYGLWIRMHSRGARMKNLQIVLVDATTGLQMYERRGGWRYAKGEWALQALLVNEGIKSPLRAVCDLILRTSVFLAPRSLRRVVYERLLRDSVATPEPR